MLNKILVIFAHPLLEKSRVNRMLLKCYTGMENVTVQDLYETYPEYNIDIDVEKEQLLQHDVIILHHPLYWYSCPPLLKQWIDMVLEVGWAYGPGGTALEGKKLMQVITSGGPRFAYSETGSNRYGIRDFLRPFEQTAVLCKMQYIPPFVIHGTHRLNNEEIKLCCSKLSQALSRLSQSPLILPDSSPNDYFNDLIEERSSL